MSHPWWAFFSTLTPSLLTYLLTYSPKICDPVSPRLVERDVDHSQPASFNLVQWSNHKDKSNLVYLVGTTPTLWAGALRSGPSPSRASSALLVPLSCYGLVSEGREGAVTDDGVSLSVPLGEWPSP